MIIINSIGAFSNAIEENLVIKQYNLNHVFKTVPFSLNLFLL